MVDVSLCETCSRINLEDAFSSKLAETPEESVVKMIIGRFITYIGRIEVDCTLCQLWAWASASPLPRPKYRHCSEGLEARMALVVLNAEVLFPRYHVSLVTDRIVLGLVKDLEFDHAPGDTLYFGSKSELLFPDTFYADSAYICRVLPTDRPRGELNLTDTRRMSPFKRRRIFRTDKWSSPEVDTEKLDPRRLVRWIQDCRDRHGDKCNVSDHPPSIRVIDCHEEKVVQLPAKSEYFPLSYTWGSSDRELAGDYGCNLPGTIPRTIHDAIEITRLLGYRRYVWIDRYYIDQKDNRDLQCTLKSDRWIEYIVVQL